MSKAQTSNLPNTILALDPATKTGWCLWSVDSGHIIESGVQDFTKRRGETNGLLFLRFRKWLSDMMPDVGLLAYERAHFRGGAATEIGVGLQTRIQEAAAEHGIEAAPVHTGTIKKWATGHGNASKEEMMARAVAYLGREPLDDNEADAVIIAAWAADEYGEPTKKGAIR